MAALRRLLSLVPRRHRRERTTGRPRRPGPEMASTAIALDASGRRGAPPIPPSPRRCGPGRGSRRSSFGGPAGQIAVMHRILVEEKRWIGEARFLHALNYCMLLPGPGGAAARHLHRLAAAPDQGRPGRRHPVRAAGLPRHHGAEPGLRRLRRRSASSQALFFGLKAAVLAIVLEAVMRIGRRALKNNVMVAHRRRRLRRHLLLRRAVPADHPRRRR